MTSFGIFYPVGYIVAGFPQQGDAERVRKDLLAGGYAEADCALFTAEEVAAAAARNLDDNRGFLARLGKSDEAVQIHLDAARQGAAFLLIYAPGDTEAARAMNVIRRVPFAFVHRYHRLAIQDMT
jgi:hypothetical protein